MSYRMCQHTDVAGYVEFASYSDADESLDRMIEHILRQLEDGYRQRDIAVLCARRSECAEVVARLLRAKAENGDGPLADLQIITDEALVVGNAPSIRQIVGVLRYVDAHVVLSHKKGADTTAAEIINRFEFFRAMVIPEPRRCAWLSPMKAPRPTVLRLRLRKWSVPMCRRL